MSRNITIKVGGGRGPDLIVGVTASLDNGRRYVDLVADSPYDDGVMLTPAEARALARALTAKADLVDASRRTP